MCNIPRCPKVHQQVNKATKSPLLFWQSRSLFKQRSKLSMQSRFWHWLMSDTLNSCIQHPLPGVPTWSLCTHTHTHALTRQQRHTTSARRTHKRQRRRSLIVNSICRAHGNYSPAIMFLIILPGRRGCSPLSRPLALMNQTTDAADDVSLNAAMRLMMIGTRVTPREWWRCSGKPLLGDGGSRTGYVWAAEAVAN